MRRHREVIGDIDLLASSKNPTSVLDFFAQQSGILNVIAKGETKASILLEGGIQSDLSSDCGKDAIGAIAYEERTWAAMEK